MAPGERKCVEYFALGLTLEASLGMNHATGTRISSYQIEAQEISFNSLTATLFHFSFVRKSIFAAKIFNVHIISMGLTSMLMYAEAYLEPSRTSMMELLCKNHKKALLQMFDWVLNTLLVQVLQQERLTECQYLSDMAKVDFKNLSLPSCSQINKKR